MKKIITIPFVLLAFFVNGQSLKKEYFEDALKIILSFETNSLNIEDGYNKVTGNFDGNGVSLGLLQWNIGTGSLQRLVKQVGEKTVLETMPKFGKDFWKACNIKKNEGLAIVNSWQKNNVVQNEQKKELIFFLSNKNVKNAQYKKALIIGKIALDTSTKWAKEMRNSDTSSFKEFVYFFDLYTFNDGLKNLWVKDVIKYKSENSNPKETILQWLNTREKPLYSIKDAKSNVKEWSNFNMTDNKLHLLILGYLRGLISNGDSGKFKADVLNRRGTICLEKGTVHGIHYDFEPIYSKYE
jgi:hypothetical protein